MIGRWCGHVSSYCGRVTKTLTTDNKINSAEYWGKTALLAIQNTAVVKAGFNWFLPNGNKPIIYLTLPIIFQLVPYGFYLAHPETKWRKINMEDCKNFLRGAPIKLINALIIAGIIYANGELNSQLQTKENSELAKKLIDLAVGVGLGLVGIPLMGLVDAVITAINCSASDDNSITYQRVSEFPDHSGAINQKLSFDGNKDGKKIIGDFKVYSVSDGNNSHVVDINKIQIDNNE